jgi:FkbM family methyltransferase
VRLLVIREENNAHMTDFKSQYNQALVEARRNAFRDNYDHRRFGATPRRRVRRLLRDSVESLSRAFGLHSESRIIAEESTALASLYSRLDDDASRELLVQLLAYRALGHRKVRLPLNNLNFWRTLDELDDEAKSSDDEALGNLGWRLAEFDLRPRGYPLRLLGVSAGIHAQVLLEQYRCDVGDGNVVDVNEGDVVIDGGGCWGETALLFASKAGKGRVFSFEFLPDNLHIFERNLALNTDLRDRVTVLPHALWSRSDALLAMVARGPGTRVIEARGEPRETTVSTLSIDDLVARHSLQRVDFLKLDIEGVELEALRGAEDTLRRYRPSLAVSVYHRLSDFWTIPAWLDTLGLDYRFYLRHFTIHAEETVLFAKAAGPKGPR